MSDTSAAGEWTSGSVRKLIESAGSVSIQRQLEVVADAHNASLAALREQYTQDIRRISDGASERHKELQQAIAALREQLAARRTVASRMPFRRRSTGDL